MRYASTVVSSSSPRQAAVPVPEIRPPRLNATGREWMRMIKEDSPHPLRVTELTQILKDDVGIPLDAWTSKVAATWERRWSKHVHDPNIMAAYAQGIEVMGPPAQALIPHCLDIAYPHQSTSVAFRTLENGEAARYAVAMALMAAGTPLQIEQAIPRFFQQESARSTSAAVYYASLYGEALNTRVGEGSPDGTAITQALRRARTTSTDPSADMVIGSLLFAVGDDHPSAVFAAHATATGLVPPRPGEFSSVALSMCEDVRAERVIRWSERQIHRGRVQDLARDELMVASIASVALSGALPGAAVRAKPAVHDQACQVFASVSAACAGWPDSAHP